MLEELKVRRYGLKADILPTNPHRFQEESELSYITLLQKISVVVNYLTNLHTSVYDDTEGDDRSTNDFLLKAQPDAGSQQFKELKNLVIAYQCLLGWTTSTVDTFRRPQQSCRPISNAWRCMEHKFTATIS